MTYRDGIPARRRSPIQVLTGPELHNVNEWALANNLKLNLAKSQEIIFTDQRRKTKFSIRDKIPLLQRVGPGYKLSHARTVVRECCKGDDESQWERVKFDPPPPKNPLTDGHQNLHT